MGGWWSSATVPTDVHVVIVGGGYGGTQLALGLKKAGAKYTLIDMKDSFQHVVGAVRAIVEEGVAAQTYIPYTDSFGKDFHQGKVVGIDPEKKQVMLENAAMIAYDILVVATGSTIRFPAHGGATNKEDAVKAYSAYLEKIRKSDRIAVVGAGPVGVEICGEIATDYPQKKVTLIHSQQWIVLEELSHKFQKRVLEVLSSLHVEIVCGQKVTNLADLPEEGPFKLTTDKDAMHYEADMVIDCTGAVRINSEAFRNGLEASMDDRGQLKVNECLQVEGQEDIFAIGDCTDLKETKLAYLAQEHGKVILETLKLRGQGKAPKKYTLDSKPFVLSVSVGRNNGLGQFKHGFMVPEFLVKSMKSKDMMVQKAWDRMGQRLPH